jgi:hypothetical protein
MDFLKPSWTDFVTNHASDADYRKDEDPDESARHYIDIDNYAEFNQYGKISQDYDSVVMLHGAYFVLSQGILPWATRTTYDSLKSSFQRGDWNRSAYFAADLGHYVGDGHMPLHITRNYNGQYSGQYGIHSRYESTMISKYEAQLVYDPIPASSIANVSGFIFGYTYLNHLYVDSLLLSDNYASAVAGSTSSTQYYQLLWDKTGAFTIRLMQQGSYALASLIYNAWVEAGSPVFVPNAIFEPGMFTSHLTLRAWPNPATDLLNISVTLPDCTDGTVSVVNMSGTTVETLFTGHLEAGRHTFTWDASSQPRGIYLIRCETQEYTASVKALTGR